MRIVPDLEVGFGRPDASAPGKHHPPDSLRSPVRCERRPRARRTSRSRGGLPEDPRFPDGGRAALGNYVAGIVRFKYWSNSGTVNAVSPWAGL